MTHNETSPLLANTFSVPPPPLPWGLLNPRPLKATHSTTPNEKQYLIDDYQGKINRLKQLNNTLGESKDKLSDTEWQDKVAAIQLLCVDIDGTLRKLQDKKKRKRRRPKGKIRPPTTASNQNKSTKTKRLERHSKIEAWRQARHDQLLQERWLEENKTDLQKFLKDNSRRTVEAVKILAKLNDETTRIENASKCELRGKLNQLIAVWKEALLEYQAEKVRLEGMLGINSMSESNCEQMWLDCLFGENSYDSCWTSKTGLEEFVKVRSDWDLYLSSEADASPIPFFWALPPLSSLNSPTKTFQLWEEYRN